MRLPPFPPRQPLALLPTEFRCLERLSATLGGTRLWLKSDDQTGAVLSGNKVRKLEFLLADALRQGCDTVITCGGLQSNHCRATAAAAARLGLRCHLLLRGSAEGGSGELSALRDGEFSGGLEGNLLLDWLCGAAVTVLSPSHYAKHLEAAFAQTSTAYAAEGRRCYLIPTGGSNAVGLWGYVQACEELREDFARHSLVPEWIVCASGSGGTQGGLTLGTHLLAMPSRVLGVAVCDSAAYFASKIQRDICQWQGQFAPHSAVNLAEQVAVTTNENYIGPGYAQGYPELFACIRDVASLEGVVLDPVYTGKAFYGMLEEIRSGSLAGAKDIVFVHTGGVFGLFPFRNAF